MIGQTNKQTNFQKWVTTYSLLLKLWFYVATFDRRYLSYHKHQAKQPSECLKRSVLWENFSTMRLATNVRAKPGQTGFYSWFLELGGGTLPTTDKQIEIPDQCISQGKFSKNLTTKSPKHHVTSISGDIIAEVFDDTIDTCITEKLFKRFILSSTNEGTSELNNEIVS